MSLAVLERSFSCKNIDDCDLKENYLEKSPNKAEAPKEITKAVTELVEPLGKIGLGFFTDLPTPLKCVKCSLNIIDLVDAINEARYIDVNLGELKKINDVLVKELPEIEKINCIYGLKTDALTNEDCEKLYKYYFSNYDDMKKLLRDIDDRIRYLERNVGLENEKDIINEMESLIASRALLERITERVILLEAFDINKANKKKSYSKFFAAFMSLISDVISLVKIPALESILLAVKVPKIIGNVFWKFGRFMEGKIDKEKAKDEEALVAAFNLPLLAVNLFKVLDKYIFKKIRDKAEASRKEDRNMRIINFLKEKIEKEKGNLEFNRLMKEKENLDEQIEALEKSEDNYIKEALKLSKQSMGVLNASAKGYLKFNGFRMKTLEDEERMTNVARFVIKRVKDLHLIENKLDKGNVENRHVIENNLKVSYSRVKSMIVALGVNKDDVGGFIDDIRNYKKRKDGSIAKAGLKENVDPTILKVCRDDKQKLIDRLVEAMKSEKEGA